MIDAGDPHVQTADHILARSRIHRAWRSAVPAARVEFQVCWRQRRIALPSMMYQASHFAPFFGKAISINRIDASTVNATAPGRYHALDTGGESVPVYYPGWQREAKTGTDWRRLTWVNAVHPHLPDHTIAIQPGTEK
ncbi:MAG: hypothetical protein HY848_16245 [Betaproteobacteria bacterium]|nr:hypothetical protein [Betaproteobacteria bacterium]